jgi:multidrug resistance efflux pump
MGVISAAKISEKKIIGRVICMFFGIMLLLTFFSRTINNILLPRVSAEYPTEGPLLKKIVSDGYIEAEDFTDVFMDSDVTCKVVEIKAENGDRVLKGDLLSILEPVDRDASARQKKIDELTYAKMELIYNEMLEDYKAGVNQLSLLAEIDVALKKCDQAERRMNYIRELYESGTETEESCMNAEMSYEIAKMEYETKMKAYEVSREKELSSIRKFEIDMKIQKEKMGSEDSYMIFSPVDGVISDMHVSNGSWVNRTTKLFSITHADSSFRFIADIDIDSADLIQAGDDVSIKVVSLGSDLLRGKVVRVGESRNFKGVKKEVIAEILDGNIEGKTGLTDKISGGEKGEIYIEKDTLSYTCIVPNSAVIPGINEEHGYVWVVMEKNGFLGRENYIELMDVNILDSDNSQTAIEGGITADDRIVVKTGKPLKQKGRVLVEYEIEE